MNTIVATVDRVEDKMITTRYGDKSAFTVFTIDGKRLSAGFKQPQLSAGKTYEFSTKGDQYNTITGYIEAGAGSAPPAGAAPPQQAAAVQSQPIHLSRERAIIRQNALTNAVNYYGGAEVDVMQILKTAQEFEAYTSGDVDVRAAEQLTEEEDSE